MTNLRLLENHKWQRNLYATLHQHVRHCIQARQPSVARRSASARGGRLTRLARKLLGALRRHRSALDVWPGRLIFVERSPARELRSPPFKSFSSQGECTGVPPDASRCTDMATTGPQNSTPSAEVRRDLPDAVAHPDQAAAPTNNSSAAPPPQPPVAEPSGHGWGRWLLLAGA